MYYLKYNLNLEGLFAEIKGKIEALQNKKVKLKPFRTNGTPLQLNALLTWVYHIDITVEHFYLKQ